MSSGRRRSSSAAGSSAVAHTVAPSAIAATRQPLNAITRSINTGNAAFPSRWPRAATPMARPRLAMNHLGRITPMIMKNVLATSVRPISCSAKYCQYASSKPIPTKIRPNSTTANVITPRPPYRSISGPVNTAARPPANVPMDMGSVNAARDHANSSVMGSWKMPSTGFVSTPPANESALTTPTTVQP